MDKITYGEKVGHHQRAEMFRIKELSNNALSKEEGNRITSSSSPYRSFEVSFGGHRFKEINDFLFSLDKHEFESRQYLIDPLLLICHKFLDWKIEVGDDRLWHEFFIRYNGGNGSENNEGSLYVIKKAWEQVKKEQDILETARQAYKTNLNKILEDNPSMPSIDPTHWCAICDGFNKFDALQEFGYPLPFDLVFGSYSPVHFYDKPLDDINAMGDNNNGS